MKLRPVVGPIHKCLLALAAMLVVGSFQHSFATGTHFDLSFDNNGRLATDFGGEDTARDVAIQPDGKIVTIGYYSDFGGSLALARYNPDGSLDTTFGAGGRVTFVFPQIRGFACALQADGKIVVAGAALYPILNLLQFAVVRFNANGTTDSTFANNGIANTLVGFTGNSQSAAGDVAIQADGKIVVAGVVAVPGGLADWAMARYNTNGSLDPTFATVGYTTTDLGLNDFDQAYAVAITSGGKIVVGGTSASGDKDWALAQYNLNGTLDTSFGGGDGIVKTDFNGHDDVIFGIQLQPDGKIVAAGAANPINKTVFGVGRYNADGTLDTSFSGDGKATTDVTLLAGNQAQAVVLQADGKIVAAGVNDLTGTLDGDLTLIRYNANGTLDAAFGQAGILRSDMNNGSNDIPWAIAALPDGKLVVVGQTRNTGAGSTTNFVVSRYLPNLHPEFDFDGDGVTDLSVIRGTQSNYWYFMGSRAGFSYTTWGLPTDRPVPADFDGDAVADIGVYRPSNGTWYWLKSSTNSFTYAQFGVAEDLPTPADYDGDGRADLSVFRPSVGIWYRLNSNNNSFVQTAFGTNGDRPTIGDYDGDGRADVAVFRPSITTWYWLNSSNGAFVSTAFGASTDIVTPGDYDGDGRTDISVFRPSVGSWYRYNSTDGAFVAVAFGANGDIPAPGDYDRDGRADLTVFRPTDGSWYRLNSSNGAFFAQQFGQNGDRPTPAAFQY